MISRKAKPAAQLGRLVLIRDKIASFRADHRAETGVDDMSREPFGLYLTPEDCTVVIDLIDELSLGDAAKKAWLKGSPRVKPVEKFAAVTWIAWNTTADKPPDDKMFEDVGLKFD